jgi:excinuclease ABC subunit B
MAFYDRQFSNDWSAQANPDKVLASIELDEMLESEPYAAEETQVYETVINQEEKIAEFEEEMREAAESLEFERAAEFRDRIAELREKTEGKG